MAKLRRWLAHLSTGAGIVRRRFDRAAMTRIHDAIAAAEYGHAGEVRFAIEAALPARALLRHCDARSRAGEVFSLLRVWDTEANTGVLLYLLWAERAIEIVADRGIAALVPVSAWEAVCTEVAKGLQDDHPVEAVISGIAQIGELLRTALPAQASTVDELSDAPMVL